MARLADRALVLVGPAGSGKSHLAHIWAEKAGARFRASHTLDVANAPADLATNALVVEDIDASTTDGRALFHLLNLIRQEPAYLLLTASSLPAQWQFDPPMRSRA